MTRSARDVDTRIAEARAEGLVCEADAALAIREALRAAGQDWLPEVAVILGSGLAGFESRLQDAFAIPYAATGLPETRIEGHASTLHLGRIGRKRVAVYAGRLHLYEGFEPGRIVMGVRVMALLGARWLLVSNAAGGLNPSLKTGDLMVISDHINLMGSNPLRGPNPSSLGPRFPDMTYAYDPDLQSRFHQAGGGSLRSGVYLAVLGPSYETPAEIRAFGRLGGDAVGMSTVPEVIAACHAGMTVGAVSCITNVAAGLFDGTLSHDDVQSVGTAAGTRLADLFETVIGGLP